jgi:hypothetical protein
VEDVRAHGIRVSRATGRSYRQQYIPIVAITWVSDVTKTIFLVEGVTTANTSNLRPAPVDGRRLRRDAVDRRPSTADTIPHDHA